MKGSKVIKHFYVVLSSKNVSKKRIFRIFLQKFHEHCRELFRQQFFYRIISQFYSSDCKQKHEKGMLSAEEIKEKFAYMRGCCNGVEEGGNLLNLLKDFLSYTQEKTNLKLKDR